jgi:transcriptional regulator with XRE-family HTH domain
LPRRKKELLPGFGATLKRIRAARGMTAAQLGKAIGVTESAVSKWELGLSEPGLLDCQKLATSLAVSADSLLGVREVDRDVALVERHKVARLKAQVHEAASLIARIEQVLTELQSGSR